MAFSLDTSIEALLREEGISTGSVWRCLRTQGGTLALLEVLQADDDQLRLKVYPGETGAWGNALPEVLELGRLSAAEFMDRKHNGLLVRVD